MQRETKSFIGADVSKLWIDVAVMTIVDGNKQPVQESRFDNTKDGMKQLQQWLKKLKVRLDEHSLVVIENTGVYHRPLWQFCSAKNLPLHIGNATHIKWSFGIARGKNDKIDARRLCEYAYRYSDTLKASPVLDPVYLNIKDLIALRTRIVKDLSKYKVSLKELEFSNRRDIQHTMEQLNKPLIEALEKALKEVEQKIQQTIHEHPSIKANYELLLTIPGIGRMTATYLICCTNNFAAGRTGKQLACYAGVVPFTRQSGTSIRGKDRVHPMANKDLKKLLHLGAVSSIHHSEEMKAYYERKIADGKHPMTVMNAIRNKIVLRAVAVIKKQTPYVNNYKKAG